MAGAIVFLFFIFVIGRLALRAKKGTKGSTSDTTEKKPLVQSQNYKDTPAYKEAIRQSEQKRKQSASRDAGKTGTAARSKKTPRRTSVPSSHDRAMSGSEQADVRMTAEDYEEIFDPNPIVHAAKTNTREVERDNDLDAAIHDRAMAEVMDLIVKGPRDTLFFERDFLAEGVDMINAFQLKD